jgi:hypothetical protein
MDLVKTIYPRHVSTFLTGGHTGSNNEDLQVENYTQSEDNGHNPSFRHDDDDEDNKT